MRGKGIMADMPVGNCIVTQKSKTIVDDDVEVHIDSKMEIRTDGLINIIDSEKTKTFKSNNKISKLYVNLIKENNIEQKTAEYISIRQNGDYLDIYRRIKVMVEGRVIDDCIENSRCYNKKEIDCKKIFNRISSVVK